MTWPHSLSISVPRLMRTVRVNSVTNRKKLVCITCYLHLTMAILFQKLGRMSVSGSGSGSGFGRNRPLGWRPQVVSLPPITSSQTPPVPNLSSNRVRSAHMTATTGRAMKGPAWQHFERCLFKYGSTYFFAKCTYWTPKLSAYEFIAMQAIVKRESLIGLEKGKEGRSDA